MSLVATAYLTRDSHLSKGQLISSRLAFISIRISLSSGTLVLIGHEEHVGWGPSHGGNGGVGKKNSAHRATFD